MSIIKRQTILGTIYSYLGVVVGTITMGLLMPNFFTEAEYGVINLLMRLMFVLVMIVSLGYNQAGIRFFKHFRNPEEGHKGYLFNALIFLVVGLAIIIPLLVVFKDWIQTSNGSDNELFVKYYYLIIPLTISIAVFNLFDNYAKGLFDTVAGTFLSQFLQRLLVLFSVLAYIAGWLDFQSFIYTWVIAMAAPAVFMIIHSVRLGKFSLKFDPFLWNAPFKQEFLRFAGFSVIISTSSMIINMLDSFMVFKLIGLSMTGIYNFCLLFGSVMTMSYYANIKASTPIVMDALQKDNREIIGGVFTKSATTQLMFGTVLLVLVWVSIDSVFGLVKPEYQVGKTALIIIGLSKLIDLASGINPLILAYSKHYLYDALVVISFIGILYGLNLYMIPIYGINGAAIATLVAVIYYNVLRNLLIWKFFKIQPHSWAQLKTLIIGLLMLGLGFLLPDLQGGFGISLLSIIYKSTILTILFGLAFYYLNISEEINSMIDRALDWVRK